MNSRLFKTSAGRGSYAQIVTICLLALGAGIAALVYFSNQRVGRTKRDSMEAMFEQMAIEQDLMKQLAKSKNRFFSDEQVTTLKKALSPHKGDRISIECPMGDLKSCYLALEINLIFEASGWIVEEFLFAAQPTPGEALIIRFNDESLKAGAEDLAQLFRSAGLSVTTQVDSAQLFDLRIVVPSKNTQSDKDTPA